MIAFVYLATTQPDIIAVHSMRDSFDFDIVVVHFSDLAKSRNL